LDDAFHDSTEPRIMRNAVLDRFIFFTPGKEERAAKFCAVFPLP
jgi:hypothetical protein